MKNLPVAEIKTDLDDFGNFPFMNKKRCRTPCHSTLSPFAEESRGSHFRSDYPETDDEKYKGSVFYKQDNNRTKLEFRSVSD